MTSLQSRLLFAFLADLHLERASFGRNAHKLRHVIVATRLEPAIFHGVLDRFGDELAKASAENQSDWTDERMIERAEAIARAATATGPTGDPADFLGAIPEGPDAPGDARDL